MRRLVFLVTAFMLFACKNNPDVIHDDSYKKDKQHLESTERTQPLAFLTVSNSKKKNIIGQTIINGIITNTATVCSYKNVRIKMLCYNEAGNMVEEHEDVIDNKIKPGEERLFKTRYRLSKGTDSIALSVMSAEVAE